MATEANHHELCHAGSAWSLDLGLIVRSVDFLQTSRYHVSVNTFRYEMEGAQANCRDLAETWKTQSCKICDRSVGHIWKP